MRKAVYVLFLSCLLVGVAASKVSAAYVTIENRWTSAPLLQAGLGGPFSLAIVSIRTNEFDLSTSIVICSSDYCDPANTIPIDVTRVHAIGFDQVFTSQVLPGVPEGPFYFNALGIAGDWGFTGVADVGAHYLIQPGVPGHDTIQIMWPWPSPAPPETPYYPIGRITFHPGAPVTTVAIRIKPGSDEPSINLASAGIIPVAILSNPTFDATQVVPGSVSLAGAKVKLIGKASRYSCSFQDVDGDGRLDLLCHVETAAFFLEPGESMAVLEAQTYDGAAIRGQAIVRIIP
jgi:hypothetical protein